MTAMARTPARLRHFQIMRGIADVDAGAWVEAHLLQSETQRGGVWLFLWRVAGADARGENRVRPK